MQKKIKIPVTYPYERTAGIDLSDSRGFYIGRNDDIAKNSFVSRVGIGVGSEDVEKSRFIDKIINRLRH
jgi:hypothetical protein